MLCRDLITSADTIIDISRSCHRLVDLAASLQAGLGQLAGSVAATAGDWQPAAATAADPSSYDRLYALGSRIKYLIDTPETLYGCLDSREHLAAARRYVRAAEVHRLLTAGQAKQVAQRFPLLQHQWPLVKKFRPQVYTAAGAWLASHGELTAEQAAATLAAQALLKPMDGAEVGGWRWVGGWVGCSGACLVCDPAHTWQGLQLHTCTHVLLRHCNAAAAAAPACRCTRPS